MTKISGIILPDPWGWNPEKDHCWVRTMNKGDIPSMPFPREEDYLLNRGYASAENLYLRWFTPYYIKCPSNVPGCLKAGVLQILERFVLPSVSEKLPMGIHYDSWVDLCQTTGVEFVFDVNDVPEDYQLASNACQIVMDVAKTFWPSGSLSSEHNPTNPVDWEKWKSNVAGNKEKRRWHNHAFILCLCSERIRNTELAELCEWTG